MLENFTEIEHPYLNYLKFIGIVKRDEYIIKSTSDNQPQLFARKYNYVGFGKCEVIDREIPYQLTIENVGNGKKLVTLNDLNK